MRNRIQRAVMVKLLILAGLGTSACVEPPGTACGDEWCPEGYSCRMAANDMGVPQWTCLARCGDGHVWMNVEQCDDGNVTSGDGCSASCKDEICGNWIIDVGEQCDFGQMNSNNRVCLSTCQIATCGDGHVLAVAEQCDDGNLTNGDGCESSCLFTP